MGSWNSRLLASDFFEVRHKGDDWRRVRVGGMGGAERAYFRVLLF